MQTLRRILFASLTALALGTTLLVPAGCKKKNQPVAFTGQLEQIDGVLGIYSIRHPKLILQDVDKLMTEVPETALLRMFLGQLAPYGYPEFSEINAGSNIGIVFLDTTAADIAAQKPSIVIFAKIKDGGKIGTLLAQRGIPSQKQGDWTLFSNDAGTFAKIKSADAIIAHLGKPQTEEIRAWGHLSPELLALLKTKLTPVIEKQLTASKLTPEARKAALAYVDVVYDWVKQLHSLGGSLDLKDEGITLTYFTQFLPDSSLGTALRYPVGPTPAVAQYVSGDALASAVIRQNPQATLDAVNTVLDALIAVDFPAVAKPLKELKTSLTPILAASDGGSALSLDVTLTEQNGRPTPMPEFFSVASGKFTTEQIRAYYRSSQSSMNHFLKAVLPRLQALVTPGLPISQGSYIYTENALTIDGQSFDSFVFTVTQGDKTLPQSTQYCGVVKGCYVSAGSEAALRKHLPALIAQKQLPHSAGAANPLQGNEVASVTLNGNSLVDTLVAAAKIDLSDEDAKAQIAAFKQGYAKSSPLKGTATVAQARATITLTLPYPFIETSIHVGQYLGSRLSTAFDPSTPAAGKPAITP